MALNILNIEIGFKENEEIFEVNLGQVTVDRRHSLNSHLPEADLITAQNLAETASCELEAVFPSTITK
jgi:hypothetical protein